MTNNQLSAWKHESDHPTGVAEERVLKGSTLTEGYYQKTDQPPVIFFRDSSNGNVFGIDKTTLYKNILLTGGAGSGKTNVLNQMLFWLRSEHTRTTLSENGTSDGVYIIFDTKADYYNHPKFFCTGDLCVGNSKNFRQKSAIWNVFEEVLADGEDPRDYEANAREIARVLFADRGSKSQPFFANAARDIFSTVIIYMIRRSKDNPVPWKGKLNNKFLKDFLLSKPAVELSRYFSIYPDMRGIISYFGDGSSRQSLGVFGELHQMIYDCFQGVFAEESPNNEYFSIRKAVRQKQNRAIFVEYDMSVGESMTPMYRLLIDLALKEALSEFANGRVHLFLDELKLLPKLSHLQDALNFGRSKKVSVIAGIQNVNQLYSSYGESGAKEILEGFGTVFAFKANDHATREYISHRYGPNLIAYRYYTAGNQPVDRDREGYTVEEWHQRVLPVGRAVVGLASQDQPFLFQFEPDPLINTTKEY